MGEPFDFETLTMRLHLLCRLKEFRRCALDAKPVQHLIHKPGYMNTFLALSDFIKNLENMLMVEP
jgi:hypothetical protein